MKHVVRVGLLVVAVVLTFGLLVPVWGSAWAAQWVTNSGTSTNLSPSGTTLQGGRVWKVLTLAENMLCTPGSTTPVVQTEGFSNVLVFRIPNPPNDCIFELQYSPDNSSWWTWGYSGNPQDYTNGIWGPFFRMLATNANSGNSRVTIKAYMYSDHAVAVPAPPTAATLTSFDAISGATGWLQGGAILVAGVVLAGAAMYKGRKPSE